MPSLSGACPRRPECACDAALMTLNQNLSACTCVRASELDPRPLVGVLTRIPYPTLRCGMLSIENTFYSEHILCGPPACWCSVKYRAPPSAGARGGQWRRPMEAHLPAAELAANQRGRGRRGCHLPRSLSPARAPARHRSSCRRCLKGSVCQRFTAPVHRK
jgi:hypothetical protein